MKAYLSFNLSVSNGEAIEIAGSSVASIDMIFYTPLSVNFFLVGFSFYFSSGSNFFFMAMIGYSL